MSVTRRALVLVALVQFACGAARGETRPDARPREAQLQFVTNDAPFTEVTMSLADCGEELLVLHRKSGTETAAFSTRDGVEWRAEAMPEWFSAIRLRCPRGQPIAVGYPGFVVRRTEARTWDLAFELPDQGTSRPARLTDVGPAAEDSEVLVATGFDGDGTPLEVRYDTRNESWEVRDHDSPITYGAADRAPSPCERGVPSCDAAPPASVGRATVCGGRLVVSGRIDADACQLRLPPRLRGASWEATVVGGVPWLLATDGSERSQTRVARFDGRAWSEGRVLGRVFQVVRWRGRAMLLGRRRVHELAGPTGPGGSSGVTNPPAPQAHVARR